MSQGVDKLNDTELMVRNTRESMLILAIRGIVDVTKV